MAPLSSSRAIPSLLRPSRLLNALLPSLLPAHPPAGLLTVCLIASHEVGTRVLMPYLLALLRLGVHLGLQVVQVVNYFGRVASCGVQRQLLHSLWHSERRTDGEKKR